MPRLRISRRAAVQRRRNSSWETALTERMAAISVELPRFMAISFVGRGFAVKWANVSGLYARLMTDRRLGSGARDRHRAGHVMGDLHEAGGEGR